MSDDIYSLTYCAWVDDYYLDPLFDCIKGHHKGHLKEEEEDKPDEVPEDGIEANMPEEGSCSSSEEEETAKEDDEENPLINGSSTNLYSKDEVDDMYGTQVFIEEEVEDVWAREIVESKKLLKQ